ncbi:MAG: hypothetical protein P1U68_07535 [Verrucomicrobiales bacterium]|nr:hypothetical protein [Verrucomicrobiales bacterium]
MSSSNLDRFDAFPERYIETQEEFEAYADEVVARGDFTACSIDTEADSMHSYETKLCLIQFSTPRELAIIDPLAIGIEGLKRFSTFIDQFEKVWMHGADYDISMFSMTFDWAPHCIFDTQIAARLLGETKFGLANLLESEYGVKLSKQSQKADWSRRPLSEKMLAYAFNDVRYLLDLGERFEQRLHEAGRYDWFIQTCDAARDSVLERGGKSQKDTWRISGWGKLSPRGLNYLKFFWEWRDEECRMLDRPAFKFLGNNEMFRMVGDLDEGRGLRPPHYLKRPSLARLNEYIQRADEVPESDFPSKRVKSTGPRLDINEKRFDVIRGIRNRKAEELGVESTTIATRSVMERMSATNLEVEERLEGLLPWQREVLAEAID